jgi:hypothetical protein
MTNELDITYSKQRKAVALAAFLGSSCISIVGPDDLCEINCGCLFEKPATSRHGVLHPTHFQLKAAFPSSSTLWIASSNKQAPTVSLDYIVQEKRQADCIQYNAKV